MVNQVSEDINSMVVSYHRKLQRHGAPVGRSDFEINKIVPRILRCDFETGKHVPRILEVILRSRR